MYLLYLWDYDNFLLKSEAEQNFFLYISKCLIPTMIFTKCNILATIISKQYKLKLKFMCYTV